MGAPEKEPFVLQTWHIVATLVAALLAIVVITISVDQSPDGHKHTTITITSANNKKVAVPKAQLQQAASNAQDTHLGNDSATPAQLQSSNKANPSAPSVSGPIPLASPFQRGCLTRSNSVNYSYRNGTKPSIIVLHLTVSPNIFGSWNDVNGVWGFLNRSSTQASANYIIDGDGHCIYAVPESDKAWAQAGYNSASACAIEVVNTGSEAVYIRAAGLHQLATVVHDCAARWHIPLRLAAVSGGRVLRSGVLSHYQLGALGGGHVDIHNFGAGCHNAGAGANTVLCVETVIRAAQAVGSKPGAGKGVQVRCKKLAALRKRGHYSVADKRHLGQWKTYVNGRHYRCRANGQPVRA